MKCSICEKPLTGRLDTYGEHYFPVCWDCFWMWQDEQIAMRDIERWQRQEWQEIAAYRESLYHGVPNATVKFKPYSYLETCAP